LASTPIQAAKGFVGAADESHGTFTKLPAGFVSPVHSHSSGYYGVVITGVVVDGLPGGGLAALWPLVAGAQQAPKMARLGAC
jgi:hypothetical protein